MIPRLTTCDNCQQHRLCRRYKGLSLCIHGKGACYRLRRVVYALVAQGTLRRDLAEYHKLAIWQGMGDLT